MSASKQDLFGRTAGAEPATPGSYGEAPSGYRLPAATRLGPVRLQIADVERSLAFYQGTIGLRLIGQDAGYAVLGAHDDEPPLVELHERRGTRPKPQRGRLGLYHFAILLPSRTALARLARHLGEVGARAGAGDHLVSEALYLQDPDNLGIEVYADRPRSDWRRIGRELMMATDPVDLPGLLRSAESAPWVGMPAGTIIGHVHLHVGDLAAATTFYSEGLGFDRMVWRYPGALFLAAGGYHHHVGVNTWAGSDAIPPGAQEARLLEWTIELPDPEDLDAVARSLARAGFATERHGDPKSGPALLGRDPWGTPVRLRPAAQSR